MIEILNFKKVDKNTLQGFIDIKIPKWGGFYIREMMYFKKGNQRWITFPSRAYEKNGEKKFYAYNGFEDFKTNNEFQVSILKSLDIYLEKNPVIMSLPNDPLENTGSYG